MSLLDNLKIFLEENHNDILIAVIITILSTSVANVGTSLAQNIVSPLLNIDLNGDGKADRKNLEEWEVKTLGTEIKVGKFVLSLLELILVVMIVVMLNSLIKK